MKTLQVIEVRFVTNRYPSVGILNTLISRNLSEKLSQLDEPPRSSLFFFVFFRTNLIHKNQLFNYLRPKLHF